MNKKMCTHLKKMYYHDKAYFGTVVNTFSYKMFVYFICASFIFIVSLFNMYVPAYYLFFYVWKSA